MGTFPESRAENMLTPTTRNGTEIDMNFFRRFFLKKIQVFLFDGLLLVTNKS